MEYYDGMTFSFTAPGRGDWPPVASGGRYDALTAVLGQARAAPSRRSAASSAPALSPN
jgi:ATP phosphoribosyltransferase regulatory subunit